MALNDDEMKIPLILAELGIPMELITWKQLPFHAEAQELVIAEIDSEGKAHLLTSEAASAWHEMKRAAQRSNVTIEIVSAFRNIERQIDIIRRKLERGMPMETILTLSAPPGYSEHHTGRAVDINTPGCTATEEEFQHTEAYRWLMANAPHFGFTLSYPEGNKLGFIYEPWHWCYQDRGNVRLA